MKKIIIFIATTILCVLLSGCWDSRESERLGLITVMGIDSTKDGQIKVVTEELISTKQNSVGEGSNSSNKMPAKAHEAIAPTISEAMEKISGLNQHINYLSHTRAIILSEEFVSTKGIDIFIDYFERNPRIRRNTWLLIAKKNQFNKVLSTAINIEPGTETGKLINGILENKLRNSYLTANTLGDFLNLLWGTGSDPYTSGISHLEITTGGSEVENQYQKANDTYNLKIENTAVFKKGKLVGWMDNDESRGLLFTKGDIQGGNISVQYHKKDISLQIIKMNSKIKPVLSNGKMQINIKIDILSNIAESQAYLDYEESEVIKIIQNLQAKEIKKLINLAFNKSKELNSDVFEFGNYFYGDYPDYFKKIQRKNYEYLKHIKLNIDVKSTINQIGLIKEKQNTNIEYRK
ncbi:MAG: hypothetical protein A2Y18_01325 [Clostridiales bacterium GWD2_32_19]|nr:MAG: hypothetical protein A2Y18_01325 [Clostridiales bacterium GWD2_32_19]